MKSNEQYKTFDSTDTDTLLIVFHYIWSGRNLKKKFKYNFHF